MQNTVRWRSDWLVGAKAGRFLGTPWSNESDANPPEGDNPRNLLFSSQILMEEEYRSIYQQNHQKTFKVILMKSHEFFPNYDKPGKRDLEPARQCSAMRRKQLTVKYVSLPLAHNCAQHRALNSKVRKILSFWDINFIIIGQ